MLLVIDVGNTNITLGVFNKDELFGTFRMKTKQPRTSDEYGITLQELVERHGIESSKINAVIIAYEEKYLPLLAAMAVMVARELARDRS